MGTFRPIVWLQAVAAAFQFLTCIPIPIQLHYDERLFRRSAVFYPFAGAVIGLVLLFAAVALDSLLPAAPAAVLLLGIWIALTGGLHMDGLMDTADGVLSHRSRERMLEIMKDSRVGAMGVIVGGWQLLLKAALLYAWLEYAQQWHDLLMLVLIPIWSRLFMVWAIAGWPYARQGEGMGRLVATVSYREGWVASLLATALTLLTLYIGIVNAEVTLLPALLSALVITVALAAATALIGWLLARYMAGKLGGLTGDTYGAINELLESALLLITMIALMQG